MITTACVKLTHKNNQYNLSVGALVLLRKGNKIFVEANMETKCIVETEEKAIQRLSHLGIHPRYSPQQLE